MDVQKIVEKVSEGAANAKQKLSSLMTYIALLTARRNAMKTPILIGPGKRSIIVLHRRWKEHPNRFRHVPYSSAKRKRS